MKIKEITEEYIKAASKMGAIGLEENSLGYYDGAIDGAMTVAEKIMDMVMDIGDESSGLAEELEKELGITKQAAKKAVDVLLELELGVGKID